MAYQDVVLADAPVGYWPLRETHGSFYGDLSVNGKMAQPMQGALPNQPGAVPGDPSVLFVPGSGTSGSYLYVSSFAEYNLTGNLTIEAWVYPFSRTNYCMMLTKTVSNGATNNTFEWRLEMTSGLPNFLQVTASGLQAVNGTVAPALNQWSHLAVTKSGTTVTHYLNAAANGTGTISNTGVTTNTTILMFGSRVDGLTFDGRLDEVALYASALSADRLAARYRATDRVLVQRWTGTAWTTAPMQRWGGAAWVGVAPKRWTGTAWV